jgi:hypothetical protein
MLNSSSDFGNLACNNGYCFGSVGTGGGGNGGREIGAYEVVVTVVVVTLNEMGYSSTTILLSDIFKLTLQFERRGPKEEMGLDGPTWLSSSFFEPATRNSGVVIFIFYSSTGYKIFVKCAFVTTLCSFSLSTLSQRWEACPPRPSLLLKRD